MVLFPNAKINLGLHITRKREDGYHDIETIFYPIALKDAIEVTISGSGNGVMLRTSGLPIAGAPGDNLCVKAWQLLKKDFPGLPAIQIHLHKNIPMGAGLGGGSADGAFTLKMLNEKFGLGLSAEQLGSYALLLGSDCPFFILNKPCYARGRGEQIEEITGLSLNDYAFVLVSPGIHISTAWAFAQLPPQPAAIPVKELLLRDVSAWKDLLVNDFEAPVISRYPEIGLIKETLYRAGAVYASMTGSGSTVYGLFHKGHEPVFSFPPHYIVSRI